MTAEEYYQLGLQLAREEKLGDALSGNNLSAARKPILSRARQQAFAARWQGYSKTRPKGFAAAQALTPEHF